MTLARTALLFRGRRKSAASLGAAAAGLRIGSESLGNPEVGVQREEVISLYRDLKRVIATLPDEPDRPGRSLKEFLDQRVYDAFSSHSSMDSVTKRLSQGRMELESLRQLSGNYYKRLYPRYARVAVGTAGTKETEAIDEAELQRQTRELLSTEAQQEFIQADAKGGRKTAFALLETERKRDEKEAAGKL